MFESILGMDLPLPAKLIVAFVIVLALIAVSMWVLRRIGGGRLTAQAARGRQPRLAVIDAAAVDNRRRLVLLRRDNVEHLVMIGGPSDIVIEQNIVRAVPVAPPREAPRPANGEPMGRGPAEATTNGHPAEPQRPVPALPAAVRAFPQPMAEPPPPMRGGRGGAEPARRPPEADGARAELTPAPMRVVTNEPRAERPEAGRAEFQPQPPQMGAPPAVEASLADMAHKLEAALRRPNAARRSEASVAEREPPPALSEPTPPTAPDADPGHAARPPTQLPPAVLPALPRVSAPAETKASRQDAKPGAARSVFDSLEEEMASLLNRGGGKEP